VATQLQADVDNAYMEKDRVRSMAEQYKQKVHLYICALANDCVAVAGNAAGS